MPVALPRKSSRLVINNAELLADFDRRLTTKVSFLVLTIFGASADEYSHWDPARAVFPSLHRHMDMHDIPTRRVPARRGLSDHRPDEVYRSIRGHFDVSDGYLRAHPEIHAMLREVCTNIHFTKLTEFR